MSHEKSLIWFLSELICKILKFKTDENISYFDYTVLNIVNYSPSTKQLFWKIKINSHHNLNFKILRLNCDKKSNRTRFWQRGSNSKTGNDENWALHLLYKAATIVSIATFLLGFPSCDLFILSIFMNKINLLELNRPSPFSGRQPGLRCGTNRQCRWWKILCILLCFLLDFVKHKLKWASSGHGMHNSGSTHKTGKND